MDHLYKENQSNHSEEQNKRMAAYLAHEVRQPLYGIRALLEQQVSADQPDIKKLQVCLQTVNDVINFSSRILDAIKVGTLEQDIRPVSMANIESQLEAVLIPIADQHQCEISLDISGMKELYLYVDPELLIQLINNLGTNSIKNAKDNGKVEIAIRVTPKEEYRVYVEIQICDNGKGMSREFLSRAKEPFVQADSDAPQLLKGSGVGLAIVEQIVDIFGGTMEMESEEGIGSRVTVQFEADASDEYYEKKTEKKEEPKRNAAFLKKKKILVAENNELYMDLVVETLEKHGAIVDKTYDGDEVVDLFADSEPEEYQAIIMDLQMPGKDGVDATDEIRSMTRADAKKVPILAFTGYPLKDETGFLQLHQMQGSIPKVFEEQELLNHLYEVLS